MKLLLEKSGSRSRLIKDKLGLDCEYEQIMEVTPIPYGINSTSEQKLCDELKNLRTTKEINWRINLKVKLEAVEALDVKPIDGKAQETVTQEIKSEPGQNYKVAIELTPYISSESGKDAISVLEMFRTRYPGTTFALDFKSVDSFADFSLTELLNAGEMKVGARLSCQQEAVISAGTAKSLLTSMISGAFENALVISVKLPIPQSPRDVTAMCSTNKRILLEELSSDLIIKAGNGAEIKCLKGFLMAQSDVLQAMFESGMEESKTCLVNMIDMSERGVRAFLKYVYYRDVGDAEEDIEIALELLYAADKYNVFSLEERMVKLITNKRENLFTPELSLKIFLFIRDKKYPEAEALKTKTIQFLKKKFGELEQTTEYKELLKKDTVAVNDLMKNMAHDPPQQLSPVVKRCRVLLNDIRHLQQEEQLPDDIMFDDEDVCF